jgi:hypothetical protein
VVSHALGIEECATNLPMSYQYGFQGISWCIHEVVLNDFNVFSHLKTHMAKL